VRVDWAILCRYAEASGGEATLVGAGLDTFFAADFPVEVLVILAVRLVGSRDEMVGAHDLAFRVHVPSMTVSEGLSGTFQLEPPPLAPPGWEIGAIFVTAQRVEATEEGPYGLEMLIDGETKHVFHFFVRQRPAPK